jgi:phosphonate transport system substrate-binding protein
MNAWKYLWVILCCFAIPAQADLRFLLPPVSSPAVMYAAFTPLAKYLSQSIGQTVTLRFSGNLESFYNAAEKRSAQIVLFCPIAYIRSAHQQPYYPLAGVIPSPGGNHSVIVVRHNSPIHNILQLRNRSFVMGDPACAASSLIPLSLFQEIGMGPKSFSAFRQSGSDQSALMDVAARFYDATAVAENVAEPYIRAGSLRVIAHAEVGPGDLLAASGEIPAVQRAKLTAALLSAQQRDPASIAALGALAVGFKPVSDGDYNVLRSLYKDIHGTNLAPRISDKAMTLGIPPAFTPIAAYRIFAPLQKALSKATGYPIHLVIPHDEAAFVADGRRGLFDFALLTPRMVPMTTRTMVAIAKSVSNRHIPGLAIVYRGSMAHGFKLSSNPLTVAFASPYCSGRIIAEKTLHRLATGHQLTWVAEGSERAVFTALADGRATLGVVRTATVKALEKELPGTWSILTSAGAAPAWTLTANRQINPAIRAQARQNVLKLPLNTMGSAGFMRFNAIANG